MGQSQRLHELFDVARIVVSSLELDQVLRTILQTARDLLDMPAGSIALYDPDEQIMELHAAVGLSESFSARKKWSLEQGSLARMVLDHDAPFLVPDTKQFDSINNRAVIAEGIVSIVAVPLKMHDQTVGILYLNDFVPRELSAEDLEPLTILTSFASMSVANARLYEATKKLAATDGLTCLYNHRQFKLSLEQELNRAERSEKPLSLLMFDIDNFKKFNDCYGHPCGDLVLSRTALSLREVFRSADFIFRYGGEEFTVLMPDADREQAINAADRARQQIEQMSVCIDEADRPLKITVSAGVATYPTDGVNAQTLLSTVDELLYKAKNQGKNRVYSTCVDALCASG